MTTYCETFKISMFSILILLAFSSVSCTKVDEWKEQNLDASKNQTLHNMTYGSHNRNKLDIALPANRTTETPVVIFIHGGAWVAGDKSVFLTEISKFADIGMACATINYRYASNLSNTHHPKLEQDIRKAIDYIASKSETWQVSSNRFGVVGHSAGGHLSLMTAYTLNPDYKIKAAASWAGPLNLIDTEQLSISGSKDIFKVYTGTDLNSSTDTMTYKSASPFWNVSTTNTPTLLIYAENDDLVPLQNAYDMEIKLNAYQIENEFHIIESAGHIWLGNNLEFARQQTIEWFQLKL